MLAVLSKVPKKIGTDCFAFKFCSWWCNGIYEEWKPEILGCRRHISPGPVLRTHSTPSETCLCIINWFRYAESFFFLILWLFSLLGSLINLDSSLDIIVDFVFQVYPLRFCQWWGHASRSPGRYSQPVSCPLYPWSWLEATSTGSCVARTRDAVSCSHTICASHYNLCCLFCFIMQFRSPLVS